MNCFLERCTLRPPAPKKCKKRKSKKKKGISCCQCIPHSRNAKSTQPQKSEYSELMRLMNMLNQADPIQPPLCQPCCPICMPQKRCRKKKKRTQQCSCYRICGMPGEAAQRSECIPKPVCDLNPIDAEAQMMNARARTIYMDDSSTLEHPELDPTLSPPCGITLPPPTLSLTHETLNCCCGFQVPSPEMSDHDLKRDSSQSSLLSDTEGKSSRRNLRLRKPHSGIFVNETDDFFPPPDIVSLPPMDKEAEELRLTANIKQTGTECFCCKNQMIFDNVDCGPAQYATQMPYRMQMNKMKRKNMRLFKMLTCGPPGMYRGSAQGRFRRNLMTRQQSGGDPMSLLRELDACGDEDDDEEPPEPEHIKRPDIEKGSFRTHSLTKMACPEGTDHLANFGATFGTFNMYDVKFEEKNRGMQALPMCVAAFCLAYLYHPKQWNSYLVDVVLECGDKWYQDLLAKQHDHSVVMGLCEVLPYNKKEYVVIQKKRMQVLMDEPNVIGYTLSNDPAVYNLCRALKVFFMEKKCAIFLSRYLKVCIWRDKVCFYVFDPAGRDYRIKSSMEGKATLVALQTREAVAELLLMRSPVGDMKFVLSELRVLKLMDEDMYYEEDEDLITLTDAEKAMLEYNIVNENYAILVSSYHMGDKCFGNAKFKQALPIAVTAMSYAKISPPNTWVKKTLDKIIKLGNEVYLQNMPRDPLAEIKLHDIPNKIRLGPYECEIIIYKDRIKGQLFSKRDCFMNIELGLEEFFEKKGYNSGLLQFTNYIFAIWRQNGMYYTFDPYPRSEDGTTAIKGKACNLMQLNTKTMAGMIEKNWGHLPAATKFTIHSFKVLRLKKDGDKSKLRCSPADEKVQEIVDLSAPGGDFQVVKVPQEELPDEDIREVDPADEEKKGDLISLVDSIYNDLCPTQPEECGAPEPPPEPPGVVELDSPTLSATQIIIGWPTPRDKTGEAPEPDPDPEPEPVVISGEGHGGEGEGEGEGEGGGEGEEEEEEEEVKKVEEELPPPPPSPQPEPELPMHDFERKILIPSDARANFRKRLINKKMFTQHEPFSVVTASMELLKPSNYSDTPDGSQIILGTDSITKFDNQVQPFTSIMAIVLSHKYSISSWNKCTVNFVNFAGQKLYESINAKFLQSPTHIFPKVVIGRNSWRMSVVAVCENSLPHLTPCLATYLSVRARCVVTTTNKSFGVVRLNGLFYLYDSGPVSSLGVLTTLPAKAAVMRFMALDALVKRIVYNNGGNDVDQFVISRVILEQLEHEPKADGEQYPSDPCNEFSGTRTFSEVTVSEEQPQQGFVMVNCRPRVLGTIGLQEKFTEEENVQECHFIGMVAMLMLTLRPIEQWESLVMDCVFEKGLQIYDSACDLSITDCRTVKNIALDEMIMNINIVKLQFPGAVGEGEEADDTPPPSFCVSIRDILSNRRYVLVRYPQCSLVIYYKDGSIYLYDPYSVKCDPPMEARWTQYDCLQDLMCEVRNMWPTLDLDDVEFYSFTLVCARKLSKKATFEYRMSPLYQVGETDHMKQSHSTPQPRLEEKISWLQVKVVPWTRNLPHNCEGCKRDTDDTIWKSWDIELTDEIYSLWGCIHSRSCRFPPENRGKQVLAMNVIAIAMTYLYNIEGWTREIVNAIVKIGDTYYSESIAAIQSTIQKNHEISLEDLSEEFQIGQFHLTVCFEKTTYGVLYSIHPDVMNLSTALDVFFERNQFGMLISTQKNLAFGRVCCNYFMFDCQTTGMPIFPPRVGVAYVLLTTNFNRFLQCMVLTLNARRHNVPFDIYNVHINMMEEPEEYM